MIPLARPTGPGIFLIAVAVLSSGLGLGIPNNFLFFLGCLLVSLILISWIRAGFILKNVEAERQITLPLHAGASAFSRITLYNRGALFPAYLVEVKDTMTGKGVPNRRPTSLIPRLDPQKSVKARQVIKLFRRGPVTFTRIELKSRFPMGLFLSKKTIPLVEEVVVYPRLRETSPALLQMESTGAQGESIRSQPSFTYEDFAGLREYRPGDSPKLIHWRSSARNPGRLLVKEFENIKPGQARILFEAVQPVSGPRDRVNFERALSLAASITQALDSRHFLIEFRIRTTRKQIFRLSGEKRKLHKLFEALALLKPITDQAPDLTPWEADLTPGAPSLLIQPEKIDPKKPLEEVFKWS